MNNEEKILHLLTAMAERLDKVDSRLDKVDSRLDKIEGRLNSIESDIEEIKEVQEEHTSCLNKLIEWTEDAAVTIRVPFMEPKLPE